MRFRRVALLCILSVISLSGGAQSRKDKIDEVLQRMSAPDMPMTEREVLPRMAEAAAQNLLDALGKNRNLGAEWNAGNPHWNRARAVIVKDQSNLLKRKGPQERQQEANARELLEELSDAELDEVFRFHRSELYRKAMRSADAGMSMLFRTSELMKFRGSEKEAEQKLKDLERSLESYKLTDEEQRQFDRTFDSPAFRTIRRGAMGQFVGAMNDPSALLSLQLAPEAAKEVARIIEEYRKTRPSPPPVAYNADFIADPARERALRREAESALGGDAEAHARLKAQAEKGDAIAQVELGRLLGMMEGGKNVRDAHEWTRRSAMQGLARAQYNLGVQFDNGIGVARDSTEAVKWFSQAAGKGFARAQLALGLMYREGRSTERDLTRGAQLVRAAADQELPGAQLAMAENYDVGIGVEKDSMRANEWLAKAVAQGLEAAKQYEIQRERFKVEMLAALKKPAIPSAEAEKAALNRQLLEAVKRIDLDATKAALDAGADIAVKDARPHEGESSMHHAARTGNVELATLLVTRGADVNAAATGGFTPLHVAAGLNRRAMAGYLLSVSADPNAKDRRGAPLHAAALQGHAQMATLLLSKGADANAGDTSGNTPLHVLRFVGTVYPTHSELVRTLIASEADPLARNKAGAEAGIPLIGDTEQEILKLIDSNDSLRRDGRASRQLALWAISKGFANVVKLLDAQAVSIVGTAPDGSSALHIAARANNPELVDLILRRGVSVGATDQKGRTPLFEGVSSSQVVERLLIAGASIDARDLEGQTPLIRAATLGQSVACRNLLEKGADANVRDKTGRSALDIAVARNSPTTPILVRTLVEMGADVKSGNAAGITALHWTAAAPAAQILLDAGANVNAPAADGSTPLVSAAKAGRGLDLIKLLVSRGAAADIGEKDATGATLLHYAADKSSPEVLAVLLELQPGYVNVAAKDGRTPLHWAAGRGHVRVVELLLKSGADATLRSQSGDTTLHFAVNRNVHPDIVAALVKAGASLDVSNQSGETVWDIVKKGKTFYEPGIRKALAEK